MSESKHTPGEWYEEDRGERIVILAAGYDREILSVDIPEGEPEEEIQRANATIARAAPQMLEALRRTRETLIGLADSEDRAGKHNAAANVRALEREVNAAIAAATGGDSEPTSKGDPNMKPGG